MKTIIGLVLAAGLYSPANAQEQSGLSNRPVTHIQTSSNESWQNNSQFYNKDNHMNMSAIPTMNGSYVQPGYSNPLNAGNATDVPYPRPKITDPSPATIILPNSMSFSR